MPTDSEWPLVEHLVGGRATRACEGAWSRLFGVRQSQQMPSVIVFHPGQGNAGGLAAG